MIYEIEIFGLTHIWSLNLLMGSLGIIIRKYTYLIIREFVRFMFNII